MRWIAGFISRLHSRTTTTFCSCSDSWWKCCIAYAAFVNRNGLNNVTVTFFADITVEHAMCLRSEYTAVHGINLYEAEVHLRFQASNLYTHYHLPNFLKADRLVWQERASMESDVGIQRCDILGLWMIRCIAELFRKIEFVLSVHLGPYKPTISYWGILLFLYTNYHAHKYRGRTLCPTHELSYLSSWRWYRINYHITVNSFCSTQYCQYTVDRN